MNNIAKSNNPSEILRLSDGLVNDFASRLNLQGDETENKVLCLSPIQSAKRKIPFDKNRQPAMKRSNQKPQPLFQSAKRKIPMESDQPALKRSNHSPAQLKDPWVVPDDLKTPSPPVQTFQRSSKSPPPVQTPPSWKTRSPSITNAATTTKVSTMDCLDTCSPQSLEIGKKRMGFVSENQRASKRIKATGKNPIVRYKFGEMNKLQKPLQIEGSNPNPSPIVVRIPRTTKVRRSERSRKAPSRFKPV